MNDAVKYYDFENFRLDVENKQLLKDGIVVALNNKALTILLILVQNSGQIIRKEDIINEVWNDHFVEDSNLTQHIYTLRKTLGINADNQTFIKTFPKTGYLFSADVRPISKETSLNNSVRNRVEGEFAEDDFTENFLDTSEIEFDNVFPPVPKPIKTQWFANYKMAALTTGILLLGVILGVFSLYLRLYTTQKVESSHVNSIAVLPFKPIGETEEDKKLGLGMADAVIVKLSKIQQIPVRPTSAVFTYLAQPNVDPIIAGRDLGVDTVLEGTVQRENGRIRVTAQLINVKTQKTLWAESFNENFRDVFAMQDTISEKVAVSLTKSLTDGQKILLEQHPTENPEAYQAYLFGIYFWNMRTKEGLLKAVEYFKKAIEIDKDYAYAYAGLADTYTLLAYYHYNNSGEMYVPAKEAALKAISLDPKVAEAYIALAQVQKTFEHDTKASRISLEKAIEISPYNATAHQRYAWHLVAEKDIDNGIREMRLARQYSPLSPVINTALCEALNFGRLYEEAAIYCAKAQELIPNFSHSQLATTDNLFFTGKKDEAIKKIEEFLQNNPSDNGLRVRLAFYYAKTGRKDEARQIFEHLKKIESSDDRRFPYLANIAFALGNREEAHQLLKRGQEFCVIPFSAYTDPFFEEMNLSEENNEIISSKCPPKNL